MSNISNDKSINETLDVIRRALEEDGTSNNKDVLLLNQIVKEDGTIEKINIGNLTKEGIKKTFDEKLSEFFEQYFEKWLNQNISKYLDKYFSKKEK
jgi:hypothetical protein